MQAAQNGRNLSLDLLRLIGLLAIMLAHATPPGWLFQLRNFGTPLLITASALTIWELYGSKRVPPIEFITRRFIRLIAPTWAFLTLFFLIFYGASESTNNHFPFSERNIYTSYSFYSGIGFVWILKIYLFLALITPFALYLSKNIRTHSWYFFLLAAIYFLHEISVILLRDRIPSGYTYFFDNVIFLILPYGLIFLYGIRISLLSNSINLIICCGFLLIFLIYLTTKYLSTASIISTQTAKYPPTLYYLSYALFWTNLLYVLARKSTKFLQRCRKIIIWLSRNSLWIYLWHIFAFYTLEFLQVNDTDGLLISIARSIYLLGVGSAITFVQVKTIRHLTTKDSKKNRALKLILG